MLVCLLAIAGVSLYNVLKLNKDYQKDRESYEKVQNIAENTQKGNINFDKLSEINPDIIAWLKLEDTVIDYPVVQGDDNVKYLSVLFDGTSGGCGTLFADSRTERPFEDPCTIIYGHHMKDGSMFHTLKEFRSKDYADEHPVFRLSTPSEEYNLAVTAFLEISAKDSLYKTTWSGTDDKRLWISDVKSKASYLTSTEMRENDTYVMLSTCKGASDTERYALIGKLVPRSM